jgi:hypothetical protein
MALVMLLLGGCKDTGLDPEVQQQGIKALTRVEIIVNEKVVFTSSDKKIIEATLRVFEETKTTEKISDETTKSLYAVKLMDEESTGLEFEIDGNPLYREAYLNNQGITYTMDYDSFRFLKSLVDYNEFLKPVDQSDAIELFEFNGWTVDFLINKEGISLPESFVYEAGDFPTALYWAYNNELSKKVGLDFSDYAGETVQVEMYRIRESLAESYGPNRNARGIVIRKDGVIVGAYLDRERSGFACALNGEVLEQELTNLFNHENDYELRYSTMEPEDLVRAYYEALDSSDEAGMWSLMTKQSISNQLFWNIDLDQLMNKTLISSDNVISAKLLTIKEWANSTEENPEFMVILEMDYVKQVTGNEYDGEHTRFIAFTEEVEGLGYRIKGVGTGP